jgi:hypothetical protein
MTTAKPAPPTCGPAFAFLSLRRKRGSVTAAKTAQGTAAVRPNPSLNTPTRYGRQRKPGLWLSSIFTVRAYAACLRGRG